MMDNLNLSYRQFHESFMQNHTGTSLEETIIVQSPIPFTTFLSIYAVYVFQKYKHLFRNFNLQILQFFAEFVIIVVSQILMFTFSHYNSYFYMVIYTVAIYLIAGVMIRCNSKTAIRRERLFLKQMALTGKRAYITCFRALVNITTTTCILAVDFKSFPRSLAKTETFGFSLMDLGVGYFIVCSALVGWHNCKSDEKTKKENFIFVQLKRNFSLLVIGLLRIYLTKNLDYQNHNSEYGVHWNFFLTLTFVRFFSTILLTHTPLHCVKYVACSVIAFHQLILLTGVQDWVISDAPRDNIISANREGIVSITGYIGLYLLSVEIRNHLLRKVSTFEKEVKLLIYLSVVVVFLYPTVLSLHYYWPCSRRLVNVTYIAWVVMLSLYLLMCSLLFELILLLLSRFGNIRNYKELVPVILESVNFNALTYFLLANLLTGIINLSVETLYVSDWCSACILILYMFILCCVSFYLYYKKYKLL